MKNILLILSLLSFACLPAQAQKLGLKGGLNFNHVSNPTELDLSRSNGFHIGLMLDTELPVIHLSTGLLYTRRGYKSNLMNAQGNVTIDYIDIPVDILIKFGLGDLVGAYVSAGPYFSFGINSQVFDLNGTLQNGFSDDSVNLNRVDTGLNLGTGVDVLKFRFGLAYGFSFTDNGSIKDVIVKNRNLKLSMGYFF